MKLWIDDLRPAPAGWNHIHSVNEFIWLAENTPLAIGIISDTYVEMTLSLDHDAGDFYKFGGDYIKIIDYLKAIGFDRFHITFHLHTANPVGRNNMELAIARIEKWKLVNDINTI